MKRKKNKKLNGIEFDSNKEGKSDSKNNSYW